MIFLNCSSVYHKCKLVNKAYKYLCAMMLLSKTVAALERQSVFDAGVPFPLCGKPFQFLFKNSDVSFTAQLFRKVFVMHILPKSPTWVCSSPLPSAPPHNAQSVIMFYHIPSQHLRHGTQMGCFAGLPAPSRQSPVLMGLAQGLTTEALGKCWTKCLLLLPKHKACTNELIYSTWEVVAQAYQKVRPV